MTRSSRRALVSVALVSAPALIALVTAEGKGGVPLPSASIAAPVARPAHIAFEERTRVGDLFYAPSGPGEQAVLTLDPTLQARAEKVLAMAEAPYGAIVVMDVDGRILALAGRSTSEPALDTAALALKPWAPSASIFKIVTAAALLADDKNQKVCVHGGLRGVAADDLVDDPRRDTLCGDLGVALARSQNAMIAKLAARHLDRDALTAWAARFGYDTGLGADLVPLPSAPSPARMPGEKLELARAAAGFWHSELSVLGGAQIAQIVASGGLAARPRLVAGHVGPRGFRPTPPAAPRRVLARPIATELARMLTATTETGTARAGFRTPRGERYLPFAVAGKTGSLARRPQAGQEPLDYSWFVGFAPADRPQIVISVLLGNPPAYRLKAHTAARLVLEKMIESGRQRAVQPRATP